MLTKILAISGKPGLYKLISTNKNLNVVESLLDGKRLPMYMQEKAIALSDISIYTTKDDVPLREVFAKIKTKENGKKVSIDTKSGNNVIFDYFEQVLPDFDKDKVYASDIKKLLNWYNLLVEKDIDFEKIEKQEENVSEDDQANATDNSDTNENK